MRMYHTQFRVEGIVIPDDRVPSLQAVVHLNGWTAKEVDKIASMALGDELEFYGNFWIKRIE